MRQNRPRELGQHVTRAEDVNPDALLGPLDTQGRRHVPYGCNIISTRTMKTGADTHQPWRRCMGFAAVKKQVEQMSTLETCHETNLRNVDDL